MADVLPEVLCGPMLRRVDEKAMAIWLVTSRNVELEVRCTAPARDPGEPRVALATSTSAKCVAIGDSVYVWMLTVTLAANSRWPAEGPIYYEITSPGDRPMADALATRGQKLGLGEKDGVAFRPSGESEAPIWYASCRKLDGTGRDASIGMKARLSRSGSSVAGWPEFLILGGDQIYADDVSDSLREAIGKLHVRLFGSKPERGDRTQRLRALGFTSEELRNHLTTLREWVCLYLIAWSSEVHGLTGAWGRGAEGPEVRAIETVLAHLPTYMIFDDHEITDDWRLDKQWDQQVGRKPEALSIIEAGVLAFTLFQHWGNDPRNLDTKTIDVLNGRIADHLLERRTAGEWIAKMPFSFMVPARSPVLVLDCRARRTSDERLVWTEELDVVASVQSRVGRDGWLLCSRPELDRMAELVRQSPGAGTGALTLILNTPLFNYGLVEYGQAVSAPFTRFADPESWEAYPGSWLALVDRLLKPCGIRNLLVIAGDVHYSFLALGAFEDGEWSCACIQVTNSPSKNEGDLVPNLVSMLPFNVQYTRALWVRSGRYLASSRLLWPEISARIAIAAGSLLYGSAPVRKTWSISSPTGLFARPVNQNSFMSLTRSGTTVRYEVVSADDRTIASSGARF